MLLGLIRKWLKKRLGISLNIVPEHFYQATSDGTLMGHILLHYGKITLREYEELEETRDPVVAHDNYQRIKEWLKRVEYDLTDSDINEIVHAGGTTIVTVLYDLYMQLENKRGTIHGVKTPTFKVEKISESTVLPNVVYESNPLCEPLMKRWDIINWERDHLKVIMKRYEASRKSYAEYLETKAVQENKINLKEEIEDTLLFLKAEETDYTYEELIAQQRAVLDMEPFEPNKDEAKKIMKHIRQKKKQRAEKTKFRLELQYELMAEVWKKIAEAEEDDFDKEVCEKLLKQSQHEKELAEKLLEIRREKEAMIEHRKKQDELDQKKQDEEFIRRLFEESLAERMKFHEERVALAQQHRRLYEEKLRLKALKHEKVCKKALEDIVGLSLKTADYMDTFGLAPDKYLQRDWATLFVKEQPIEDLISPPSRLKQPPEDADEEVEEIYRKEFQRQKVLDEQDLEDYVHFQKIWKIEGLEEFVAAMELGMNCLGYAVHKLLLKKYPVPMPEKSELSQEIEISVCANNVTDFSRLEFLRRLLQLRSVKVITMEDAIDFCVKAYESELKTEFDEPFPEEEYLKELSPRREKSETKGKKGKKEKKGKDKKDKKGKDKKDKKGKDKKDKKGKDKKGKGTSSTEVAKPSFEEKQAQTPRLFPWERVVFSNKAKLGRIAKQLLGQDEVIDDKLLVDMFLEYLLSMPNIKGWVLLNYPTTYEQAALLEQALTGKPAPKQYFDKILNKESLASVQVEEASGRASERVSERVSVASSIVTLDEVQSGIDHEASHQTAVEEPMQSIVSAMKTPSRRATISSTQTELSEITMFEASWNSKPKFRIAQILPDLVPLAYSSEEEMDVEEAVEEDKKGCVCICSPNNSPKQMDSPEWTEASGAESGTINVILLDDEDNLIEEAEAEATEKYKETEETEKNEEECSCYVHNLAEGGANVEHVEDVTQTDILGLEPVNDNEQPLERSVAEDVNEEKRLSKIVPNPRPLEKEEYKTVLTAYIKLEEKEEKGTDDYQIPCYKELDKVNGLEKFYCDQGCYYLLEYDEFNGDTVKCLAKMIIGDYSLPLKNSVEIFGERYLEAFLEDGDHKITKKGKEKKEKKKPKKGKGNKSESKVAKGKKSKEKVHKGKKGKGSKSTTSMKGKKGKGTKSTTSMKGKKGKKELASEIQLVEHEDKEVQVPMIEDDEEDVPEPKPGEPDWEYIDLPIPSDAELALASLWDNFEDNYVKNFKDLFFNQRVLLNDIVPFLAKTRETMSEFITRPDEKQYYLREFQKILNQMDLDMRNDEETKTELFCLVDEFQEKLLGICDTKMRESEEERRNFVRNNWLFHQFCEMSNTVTVAFQMEIDRLVDTLQFLSDYYSAVITKSIKEGYEFHKQKLPKHKCEERTSEAFNVLFVDMTSENDEKTEFHRYVEEVRNVASGFVESMKKLAQKPVADMKKHFEPKEKEAKKEKKGAKGHKFEPDEDVKENHDRIFEEWQCAIDGEFARMQVHLNVLRNEAVNRFNDVITWIKIVFERIFNDVSQRYENEMASVHKACKLLAQSVEREVIIQPELTFEGDQLAQIAVTLFPETLQLEEDYSDGSFKLEQLERMVKILFDLAGNGFIMKKTFLLLIQDILYQDEEEVTETPTLWRNLSITALNALLKQIFEDEKYLYWKDFIVCNLMVAFPSNEELMDVRRQFRSYDVDLSEHVTREEFDAVSFWFDDREGIDLERLKKIIFMMYQTSEDCFNYTPFLLDFCKDADQVRGFVKALELSLGKFICYDKDLGEKFVTEILQDRILFEQQVKEHEENMLLAGQAVSLLIDKVVEDVDGPEGFDLREVEDDRSVSSLEESVKSEEELSQDKLISERKFSYKQIGFEARDDTEMCYFLPLELVLIIVKTEVSWNSKVADLEESSFKDKVVEIYEECRSEQFNNVVLAHEFLHCDKFKELLEGTHKFLAHNPVRLVKTILEDSSKGEVLEEFLVPRAVSDALENQ